MPDDLLNKLQKVEIERPETKILQQLKALIARGELQPGQRLPSERAMAEQFGTGRGYVRRAIQKLTFYGILKTHPQSGTVVADTGATILESLISNMLQLENFDYQSLIETRKVLETSTAAHAATRATPEQLKQLSNDHQAYSEQIAQDKDGMEEDIIFHIRIAECAQNPVLRSLIMVIAGDIIRYSRTLNTCAGNRKYDARREHEAVYQAIVRRKPRDAEEAMRKHLENTKAPGS